MVAAEVMDEWITLVRACAPWSEMWLDDVSGEFRAILDELLEPRAGSSTDERAERLRRRSRAHGAFRRRQGCAALVLSEEIAFAKEAIAIALIRGGSELSLVTTVHDSLAPVMRGVERASYSGYVDLNERPGKA